jgi:hypothetical protein
MTTGFPAVSGYGQLQGGAAVPELFNNKVLRSLKIKSIVDEITNNNYEGEIKDKGDTVRIIKQPTITVSPYRKGQQLERQEIVDEDLTLVIDQGNKYGYAFEDIELVQSHIDWEDACADAAGYALRKTYDQEVLNYMAAEVSAATTDGSGASPRTVGHGSGNNYTPYDAMTELATLLDEQDVPEEGRFIVARPRFWKFLAAEDSKLVEAQVMGDPESMIRNRKLATSKMIAGFTCFKSNHAPSHSDFVPLLLAGHVDATATATQVLKSRILPNPNAFGTLHDGVHIYGRKVLRPVALAKMFMSLGNL